jgi:hypothetical protein
VFPITTAGKSRQARSLQKNEASTASPTGQIEKFHFCSLGKLNIIPMRRKKPKTKKPHILVGTWVNGDEYATEVEFLVRALGSGFGVRAIDRYDGEEAEVYDVKWDGTALSFATHWRSTGRFMKCRLHVISQNRVDYTYTYTQQEMWHRKKAKRIAG